MDIANFPIRTLSGVKLFLFSILRLFFLVARAFVKKRYAQIASGLTYYSIISLVPILAVSFVIADGFGFREYVERGLFLRFGEKDILEKVILFVNNLILELKSGPMAFFGISILFLGMFKLISNLEIFFRKLWRFKKRRSFLKRFFLYLFIILVVPIFLGLSGLFKVVVINDFLPILKTFYFIFPYILIWSLFFVLYRFLPERRVKFLPTLIASIVSATLFEILEWGYIFFQVGVTRYNAIYGSFAALPLFLIWLQLSWIIFLIGAEISFLIEHIASFEGEKIFSKLSISYRKILSMYVAHLSILGPINSSFLYLKYKVPISVGERVIALLVRAGIVEKIEGGYRFLKDPKRYSVEDFILEVETSGLEEVDFIDSDYLERLRVVARDKGWTLLKDI